MKVLYDWLKEFTNVTLAPAELRERLSMAGIAVEGLAETAAGPLLDADLTINRPDCLGHYGMAREVAALERGQLRSLDPKITESSQPTSAAVQVDIECPDLCARYTARIVRNVKVRPSPEWLRRRLEALGQASINNVVDATNYVMLELGQPLHAFDLDRLAGPRIVVRRARAQEKMRTLDGVERALPADTCVIADGSRGVAIGGIMGGAESEISAATRNVLIEAAWFDPIAIRRTSKALGLRTEASLRFERGVDPEIAEVASRRCAELIQSAELGGGEVLAGVVDVYPGRRAPLQIPLTRRELVRILGADVPDREVESILRALGFAPRRLDAAAGPADSPQAVWQCVQPSWRQDVTREIDLIEEVARHYGFEHFPPRLPAARRPAARLKHAEAEDRLRERLIGLGYQEIATIPLVNEEEDALFRRSHAVPVRVANPLAEDASVMRSNGLISMAHVLAWNLNRGQRNLRLFEIARIYRWKDGLPDEMRILSMGATGAARQKGPFESEREFTFADLKGDLDQLGDLAGGFAWNASSLENWQHRAQAGRIELAGRSASHAASSAGGSVEIGIAAKVGSRVAERFKLRQDVYLGGFWLDPYYAAVEAACSARRYNPISRYPAVERDFSLTLSDGTTFASVRQAIAALKIPEITAIEAVDLFRGKTIASGKFSLLVRVTFQSQETTLTENQVNEYSAGILDALEREVGAALRSA